MLENSVMKYLYITNEETNTDNRPAVATFEGLSVPQFPFKYAELPLLFAEVAKGGGEVLAKVSAMIEEEIMKQELFFIKNIAKGDANKIAKLKLSRFGTGKEADAVIMELPQEVILLDRCMTAFYNSCGEKVTEDLEDLYATFRAEQLRKSGNEKLADVIENTLLWATSQLFYLTGDNSRLLVVLDCFEEDIKEEDKEHSDFVCDITEPILQGLKETLGGLAEGKGFADIVKECSREELEKLLAFVIWGYETNGEAIIIKKITTF